MTGSEFQREKERVAQLMREKQAKGIYLFTSVDHSSPRELGGGFLSSDDDGPGLTWLQRMPRRIRRAKAARVNDLGQVVVRVEMRGDAGSTTGLTANILRRAFGHR